MSIVDMASGLVSAVQQLAKDIGSKLGASASGATMDQAIEKMISLQEAADAAYQADLAEASNLFKELSELWEHKFNYLKERDAFFNAGKRMKESVDRQIKTLETVLRTINARVGPVPGNLESDAEAWQTGAKALGLARGRIDGLRTIKGWTGVAAGGYANANAVQGGATEELTGVAQAMSSSLRTMAYFNRALFLMMRIDIGRAISRIQSAPGANGDMYFTRTAEVLGVLPDLALRIRKSLQAEPVAAAASQLSSGVNKTMSAPSFLKPGNWPTGGGQANVPPTNPNNVNNPDNTSLPNDSSRGPDTQGPYAPGVQR